MNIPSYAKTALTLLKKNGYTAYCVGGCVRDYIMGNSANDYDITTSALPEKAKEIFADYKNFDQGIKHGTLSVLIEGNVLEITTYRIDGKYKDNRHPEAVIFSDRIEDDLSRRDFTVNAIACDLSGNYIDPFGGFGDIENKIIRCVGKPTDRFKEDALRILRAIRFSSVLDFKIEENTAIAIHECKDLLCNISKERIYSEFVKLLSGVNVRSVLSEYSDVISVFIPEIIPCIGFDQKNKYHCYNVYEHICASVEAIAPTPILRQTMFFHDIGKPKCFFEDENGGHFHNHNKVSAEISHNVLKALKASNNTVKQVEILVYHHDAMRCFTKKSIRRLIAKIGEENVRLLFSIERADASAQAPEITGQRMELSMKREKIFNEILNEKPCFSIKSLEINGNDLKTLDIDGIQIGTVLKKLFEEVLDNTLENKHEELIKRAKEIKNEE